MTADCVFCGIVAGSVPAKLLHQDERVIAFPDLHPLAPFHALVVPRRHIASLAVADDPNLLGELLRVAAAVAREAGFEGSGYRVSTNVGRDAGQEVPHLHFHVLAGRPLGRAAGPGR